MAITLWLRHARYLMCCVVIANLAMIPSQLQATQSDELRLFHEPIKKAIAEDQTGDQTGDQSPAQASVHKPPDAGMQPANVSDIQKTIVYQYNGFISSATGKHFFVNGLPLIDIDTLVLVSVKHGGKSLVLKTSVGRTFELLVGQSISQELL